MPQFAPVQAYVDAVKQHYPQSWFGTSENDQIQALVVLINRLADDQSVTLSDNQRTTLREHCAHFAKLLHFAAIDNDTSAHEADDKTHDHGALAKVQEAVIAIGRDNLDAFSRNLHELVEDDSLKLFGMMHYGVQRLTSFMNILQTAIYAETIGHGIVYHYQDDEQEDGLAKTVDINILGKDKMTFDRNHIRVTNKADEVDEGLVGEVMTPSELEKGQRATIVIGWAGTHSAATGKADTQHAPGEESFKQHEDQIAEAILKQWVRVYKATGVAPVFFITGHSLGASLSQQTHVLLLNIVAHLHAKRDPELKQQLDAIQTRYEANCKAHSLDQHITNIDEVIEHSGLTLKMFNNSITTGVWNPPGVSEPVRILSNELATLLKAQKVKNTLFLGHVHGDGVVPHARKILDDVNNNGAQILVAKHNDDVIGVKTKAVAPVSGIAYGAVMGSAIAPGVGTVIGAIIGGVTGVGAVAYKAFGAHTKKHFTNIAEAEHLVIGDCELQHLTFLDSTIKADVPAILNEINFVSTLTSTGAQLLSRFDVSGVNATAMASTNPEAAAQAVGQASIAATAEKDNAPQAEQQDDKIALDDFVIMNPSNPAF